MSMTHTENQISKLALNLLSAHRKIDGVTTSESLTAAGLTSLDMVNFLLLIEESCGVTVPIRAVNPTNFFSIQTVAKLIDDLKKAAQPAYG